MNGNYNGTTLILGTVSIHYLYGKQYLPYSFDVSIFERIQYKELVGHINRVNRYPLQQHKNHHKVSVRIYKL